MTGLNNAESAMPHPLNTKSAFKSQASNFSLHFPFETLLLMKTFTFITESQRKLKFHLVIFDFTELDMSFLNMA